MHRECIDWNRNSLHRDKYQQQWFGSLRQAILDLNAGPSQSSIIFQLSGSKVFQPTSLLPMIQKSVSINPGMVAGIVIDGSSAGFADGLVFAESTVQYSNIYGIEVRDFQAAGIVVNPSSSNEIVNINNCYIHDCGGSGVVFSGGSLHEIADNSVIESNGGWGVFVSSPVENVQVLNSAIQDNTLGGLRFAGNAHEVLSCYVVGNGSNESSDHRAGVLMDSTTCCCRVVDCTLAGNTPWGVKRLSGGEGEVRGCETYGNAQLGFKILGAHPNVTLRHFVVDSVHNKIIIGGTATGSANGCAELEFFVPIEDAPDTQGAAYLNTADIAGVLNGSGTFTFFTTFNRNAVIKGTALGLPAPVEFQIDNEDAIVATASCDFLTSEFSARSDPTLPGDFDLDGDVDGFDYLIWQANFNRQNAKYWEGDADFDGDVDNADKDIWDANFGQTL